MVPRRHRLTASKDISAVIKQGRRLVTPYVVIFYLPAASPLVRIACIVSKRVSSSSVIRHRYRRWLQAIFISRQPKTRHLDMVWLAKTNIINIKKMIHLERSLDAYLNEIYN
jgi:ribonuclease P protein component